jgi:hypothetical protein
VLTRRDCSYDRASGRLSVTLRSASRGDRIWRYHVRCEHRHKERDPRVPDPRAWWQHAGGEHGERQRRRWIRGRGRRRKQYVTCEYRSANGEDGFRILSSGNIFKRNAAMENGSTGFKAGADSNTFWNNDACGDAWLTPRTMVPRTTGGTTTSASSQGSEACWPKIVSGWW